MTRKLRTVEVVPSRITEGRMSIGLSITELAKQLEISRQALSNYELGNRTPSIEIMVRLAYNLKLPLAFFTKPESKKTADTPNFFRSMKSADRNIRNIMSVRITWERETVEFLKKYVNFPTNTLPDNILEKYPEDYTFENIDNMAEDVRKDWEIGNGPIKNLTRLMEKNGIFVYRIDIYDEKVDACSRISAGIPIVAIGKGKETACRLRFSLAHELGHLIMHSHYSEEDLINKKVFDKMEKEANRFASAFLLPRSSFTQEVFSVSIDDFISLKKRWGCSIAAMIYRCQDLQLFSENQVLYLRKQMSGKKYNQKEPLDDVIEIEKPILLDRAYNLIKQQNKMIDHELTEQTLFSTLRLQELIGLDSTIELYENNIIELEIR